jgi:hypothetical protein
MPISVRALLQGTNFFGQSVCEQPQGKAKAAESVQSEFQQAWQHADVKLDLSWF